MTNYSVLMSVYFKENPEYLRESMMSIWNQTLKTDDFVLVCDGPLIEELNSVINEMQIMFGKTLHIIRLKENSGLGIALNEGLEHCKNELIARMDSDDVSRTDRCGKQVKYFESHPDLKLLSGIIHEFDEDIHHPTGKRELPLTNDKIRTFSRKRNPMNHPCVMFCKSAVIDAGGYRETYHLFEDYDLWIRMLLKDYEAANLNSVLLDMRTPADIYLRRGGKQYARDLLRFHKWLKSIGWSTSTDYMTGAIPHAIVCILPNGIRRLIYKRLH